jgi:hypothetical protein
LQVAVACLGETLLRVMAPPGVAVVQRPPLMPFEGGLARVTKFYG